MLAFREAVQARDLARIESLLADDVVFRSPAVFTPYEGKPITLAILTAVIDVFENFRYVREIDDPTSPDSALVFLAEVDGLELTGCDIIHVNDEGLIDDFMVMVRPMSGLQALASAMAARFDAIKEQAAR
ncbi:MAG: nuclear transport factor 2 family protein [Actinomycetia bacterium]|nr:nuclear transport factor 2 family protein [Actinomycetes bacterium]